MNKNIDKIKNIEFTEEQKARLQAIAENIRVMTEPINQNLIKFIDSYYKAIKPIIDELEEQLTNEYLIDDISDL